MGEIKYMEIVSYDSFLGKVIFYIKNKNLSPNFWKALPIQVTEISHKLDRSGRDLGWALIANGTRYKLKSFGKTWFLSLEDAQKFINGNIETFRNSSKRICNWED